MRFSAKQRKMLIRIVLGAVLLIIAVLLPFEGIWRFLIFLVPYLIVGYAPLLKAGRNILHGQIFDENFLMALATIGALALGEYPEAVAVMLFYQVGELFENVAVGRSRASIRALMEIRPDTAAVKRNGIVTVVTPEEVEAGEIIVVAPGEKIPLDGVVLFGHSFADTSALTGESVPRELSEGSEALSGCINQGQQAVWRVYGCEYSGACRACGFQKGENRELYHALCKVVYALCRDWRGSACRCTAAVYRLPFCGMDQPCAHLSCHLLSLRAGHQRPARLFRWDRRRIQVRNSD